MRVESIARASDIQLFNEAEAIKSTMADFKRQTNELNSSEWKHH